MFIWIKKISFITHLFLTVSEYLFFLKIEKYCFFTWNYRKTLFEFIVQMIFKRFSFHRKKSNFLILVNKKCLKAISSVKTKIFETLFLNIYLPWLFHSHYITILIHKLWVDLKNERKHKTQSFLAKISKSPWNKPISRAMSASQKLQLLEIWLDLCCSVVQFIPLDCGSIVVAVFELSLSFAEKKTL